MAHLPCSAGVTASIAGGRRRGAGPIRFEVAAPVATQGHKLLLGFLQQGNCKAQGCCLLFGKSAAQTGAAALQQARQPKSKAPSRWSGKVKAEMGREALRAVSRRAHVNMVLVQSSEQ